MHYGGFEKWQRVRIYSWQCFSFSVNVDCITLSVVLHFAKFSVKEPTNKFAEEKSQ